jgi:6-phosphogluconate dehydrogenase
VAVWNLEPQLTVDAVRESGNRLQPAETLEAFVKRLRRPRKILMMIQAGRPVDEVIESLKPLLEAGDIVIDGGNSWFEDTRRRAADLAKLGVHHVGLGVSGGSDGARRGPALMPGCTADAYASLRALFEQIAAKSDSGPCVTHVGTDGAGHFVKMVHNGIEYAEMQSMAEAYHLCRDVLGQNPEQLSRIFASFNAGPLQSFLMEITSAIFAVRDTQGEGWLVDRVLDKAAQKGTGRWTAEVALKLGVPVPTIGAALDARVISSFKDERVINESVLPSGLSQGSNAPENNEAPEIQGSQKEASQEALRQVLQDTHDALYATKIITYAQGFSLIAGGAATYGWELNPREIARTWKSGCIIRAAFLDEVMGAFERDGAQRTLLRDEVIVRLLDQCVAGLRATVARGVRHGIALPAFSASLAYYDAMRSASQPQNLVQAQRDAFGAHTYQRTDDPQGSAVHTDWLKAQRS